MYDIWWIMIPVLAVLAVIYGIVRYRLHNGRLVLQEEEKLLAGQLDCLQREQQEINAFRAQIVEEIYQWKMSRQDHPEPIETFQNDLLSDMEADEEQCFWQDALLDLTFRHRLDECRLQQTEVTLEGFPQEGMPVPKAGHAELISLMINLFDNAREACQLIPEEEERWIRVEVRKDGSRLFMSIRNSCNDRSRQRFGKNTWKQDADEHGIGMDIINDLVIGMKGWIKSERRENVYLVELMLPVERRS